MAEISVTLKTGRRQAAPPFPLSPSLCLGLRYAGAGSDFEVRDEFHVNDTESTLGTEDDDNIAGRGRGDELRMVYDEIATVSNR
jgi:hypothetical protein